MIGMIKCWKMRVPVILYALPRVAFRIPLMARGPALALDIVLILLVLETV